MAIRTILTDEAPVLHKVCKPVINFDGRLHKLLDDMKETLVDSGGVGLAAPQVGILRRVVLVDNGKQILECFYNRGTIEDYCAITPLGLG